MSVLSTTRTAVADAVTAISGVRCTSYPVDTPNVPSGGAAAMILRGAWTYHETMGNTAASAHTFRLKLVAVASRDDPARAEKVLDALCDPTGSGSVLAAVEADATATAAGVDYLTVISAGETTTIVFGDGANAITYMAVEFEIEGTA